MIQRLVKNHLNVVWILIYRRFSDQNGIYPLNIIVQIYHSVQNP